MCPASREVRNSGNRTREVSQRSFSGLTGHCGGVGDREGMGGGGAGSSRVISGNPNKESFPVQSSLGN